jgi:hypothetical protein
MVKLRLSTALTEKVLGLKRLLFGILDLYVFVKLIIWIA